METNMVVQFPVGGFDKNFSYFIVGNAHEVAIVDPCGKTSILLKALAEDALLPKYILITHSHSDHIEGIPAIQQEYDIPVLIHAYGEERINNAESIECIEDGDIIEIGRKKIEVIHTPGHIDDAVCYFISEETAFDGVPKLITGDTLFVGGCGRADLTHSDVEELYESLERLKELPDETEIYTGHDYGKKKISTIEWEKEHNKYLKCKDFTAFRKLRLPQG